MARLSCKWHLDRAAVRAIAPRRTLSFCKAGAPTHFTLMKNALSSISHLFSSALSFPRVVACTGCGVPKRPRAQVKMQARWVGEVPEAAAVWLHPDLCTFFYIYFLEKKGKQKMNEIYDLSF